MDRRRIEVPPPGDQMCTQDRGYSVALPDTVDKPESQMGRTGETLLLLMATTLFCEGRRKFGS